MTRTTAGARAPGYKPNVRRIAVTMDEKLFDDIKAIAVEDDRSISEIIVRYVRMAMRQEASRSAG